jgi:hypothetical protein
VRKHVLACLLVAAPACVALLGVEDAHYSNADASIEPSDSQSDALPDAPSDAQEDVVTADAGCALPRSICDDFDEDGGWSNEWSVEGKAPILAVDTSGIATSGKGALHLLSSGPSDQSATLAYSPNADRIDCSFDLRIDGVGSNGHYVDVSYSLDGKPKSLSIFLDSNSLNAVGNLADGGQMNVNRPFTLQSGKYWHVHLVIDLAAGTMQIDKGPGTVQSALIPSSPHDVPDLRFGGVHMIGSWDVRFDTLRCDFQ